MRFSLASSLAVTMSSTRNSSSEQTQPMKHRILCLHGKFQSGTTMSNKIAGARRKLARVYDLDFLDAPFQLPPPTTTSTLPTVQQGDNESPTQAQAQAQAPPQLAWWLRSDDIQHLHVDQGFDYVVEQTKGQRYDALIGFSQGGALATALALSGAFPDVKAVITAGSPFVEEAFDVALSRAKNENGQSIPKLHFAGETDAMVPVESTRALCERGGNGELIVHEKGHLFPTKAVYVNYMVEFLAKALQEEDGDHNQV